MAKAKLTADEKRAQEYCDTILNYSRRSIVVEWKKSRTWGHNPSVVYSDGTKVNSVSGCGYNKISAVLSQCLQFLGKNEEERRTIRRGDSAGLSTLVARLREVGWNLRQVASGPTFDAFEIEPLADIAEVDSDE